MSETVENKVDGPGADARTSGIRVRVFGRTDVGLVREHNEDNFLIADLTSGNRSILPEVRTHVVGARGSLFAVCDGMGGAAAGEVASRIGVDTIYEMLQDGDPPIDDITLARRLDLAICEAGTRIFTAAKLNRGQRGMGTTSTVAALVGPRLILGQVGDSRAHIIRRGELVQVTKDQSLVQQLIDAKQLTEEEARDFDRSNIILQALGTTEEVHVDVTSVELRRGDALVMCSDGLSGMVEPEAIRNAVLEFDEPMEACRRLTELACDGGGDDNITVIVARFDGEGLLEPTPEDVLGYAKFEYPKTTETTVRAAISRFVKSDAPPKDEGDAVAAAGPAPAAESGRAPKAGGKPEEDRGAPAAAPVAEEAPQAGRAKEPPAEDEPPRSRKGVATKGAPEGRFTIGETISPVGEEEVDEAAQHRGDDHRFDVPPPALFLQRDLGEGLQFLRGSQRDVHLGHRVAKLHQQGPALGHRRVVRFHDQREHLPGRLAQPRADAVLVVAREAAHHGLDVHHQLLRLLVDRQVIIPGHGEPRAPRAGGARQ